MAVQAIADDAWTHVLATDPRQAMRAGVRVDRLPHTSLSEAERDAAMGRSILKRLDALDTSRAAAGAFDLHRATMAYLRYLAHEWVRAPEAWWWHFPVAPYQTYDLSTFGRRLFDPFPFEDAGDVERYLTLAADLAARIRAANEKLAAQCARGWALPAAALPGFRDTTMAHCVNIEAFLHISADRLRKLATVDRGLLVTGIERIVERELRPAFNDLLAYLNGPGSDTAIDGVGLSQYPGGEDAYRQLVRRYATYDISPEEVHNAGLEQVQLLSEQMADVRANTRPNTSDDHVEETYRTMLERDPRFHATTPDDVAATYRRHVSAIEPLIDRWFASRPHTAYAVERLDRALEAGMTYGYYDAPTSQVPVGRYLFNGSDLTSRTQINAAALIFHELIPGHHFHLARQAEDPRLHPLLAQHSRTILGAYTEGWAEYAASLGFEMGLYEDPWDRYGALLHQRFVAQRLVVDTGLNSLGWSLDRARAYMSAMTMESEQQVRSETLRYSTDMPAQALSYRLGWMKMWELRHRAEDALGTAFDVRDFHEVVLGAGALPLSVITSIVDTFIRSVSGSIPRA